jgi:hypothetical protein
MRTPYLNLKFSVFPILKRLSNVVQNKKGASRGRRLLEEGSGRAKILVKK